MLSSGRMTSSDEVGRMWKELIVYFMVLSNSCQES